MQIHYLKKLDRKKCEMSTVTKHHLSYQVPAVHFY